MIVAEKLKSLGFSLAMSLNELKEVSAGSFFFIDLPLLDISSTYIRNRIKQGLSIRYLETDAVSAYICDNALYQN
jgi:nicotinate-nucleotide adenylyltransferase